MGESDQWSLHVTHKRVVVHPIVLLSVVDHYNRCAAGTNRRVVGTILGETIDGEIHVTNSFAVPFEEDPKNPMVWYFDHNYHEKMFQMFKKINTKERVIGWYSTGPNCRTNDLEIHELYRKCCSNPVYIVVDIVEKDESPIDAYISIEEPTNDERFRRTFAHVPSTIGAFEAEEVGLEHLLRDLTNITTSTISKQIEAKISALGTMAEKLREVSAYLSGVITGAYTMNPAVIYLLQDMFNMMPNMENEELMDAFAINLNDTALMQYLASILRAFVALHNLINNMAENKRLAKPAQEAAT